MVHIIAAVQAKLAEIYGPNHYYTTNYTKHEESYWGHIPGWMEIHLMPMGRQARILDIGPGYGTLAAYASRLTGASVLLLDRMPFINKDVRQEFGLVQFTGDVERQEMPASDLDAVLMTEVLEHFNFKALPTLTKIRHAMTPQGFLFLSTPDSGSRWGKTNTYSGIDMIPTFNPETDSYDKPVWKDGHIWQFSKDELESLLYYAGFTIKHMDYSASNGGIHFNLLATA